MKTYLYFRPLGFVIAGFIILFGSAGLFAQSITVLDCGSRYSTNICPSAIKASQRNELAANPPGDASGDGILSPMDVALIKQHILGAEFLDAPAILRADANQNGKTDVGDVIYVQQHPSPAVIKDTTIFLDDITSLTVVSVNLPEILIHWTGAGDPPFQVGHIISGTRPVGFLRRVKSFDIYGAELAVQTLDATLTEALDSGWFSATMDMNGAEPDKAAASLPGAPHLLSTADGLYWDLSGSTLFQSANFDLTMPEGFIRFDPDIDVDWDIGGTWVPPFVTLDYFYFGAESDLEVEIDLEMKVKEGLTLNKSFDIPGLKASKRFSAGYVEGYVEAKIVGKIEVVGEVSTTVRTGFYSRMDVGYNVEYIRGGWTTRKWKYFELYGKPVEVEIVEGGVTVRATIAPVLSMIFYEVVGPTISFEPYLKFAGTGQVLPPLVKATLSTGFDIVFGISFRIFDATLFDLTFATWKVWGPEVLWSKTLVNSIAIDVTPDGGEWDLTGPAHYHGSGDRLGVNAIINPPPGVYTLTCLDNMPGFNPPPFTFTRTLTANQSVTFRPSWIEGDNGVVIIDASPNSGTWKLEGPPSFGVILGLGDRKGESALIDAPPGNYKLTCFDSIPKAFPPASQQKTLLPGGSAEFDAAWTFADILTMIPVPPDTFTMGRRDDGDDGTSGADNELPRHEVMLSGFEIGKFEVTNAEYCDVLNTALGMDYLQNSSWEPYTGGDVFMRGNLLLAITSPHCQIEYLGEPVNAFVSETRDGQPMDDHPVCGVTWNGAIAFCNWLSEREGLTPVYSYSIWDKLNFQSGGYRLPSEAEWERAAAWDGAKHWIYGFMNDVIDYGNQCNYIYMNPMGLISDPRTSPVGWFNGINVSPNGGIPTVDSPSPSGCYDMSGNLREWCQDNHDPLYCEDFQVDPVEYYGSSVHVLRGGNWRDSSPYVRTASRSSADAPYQDDTIGFRVARTMGPVVTPTPTPSPSPTPAINYQDMISIEAGTFTMGRRDDGADATGGVDELPRHEVTLSAYEIAPYEVTNNQYCEVLNWALGQGLLENSTGGAYDGGDVYHGATLLLKVDDDDFICEHPPCQIEFHRGAFRSKTQRGMWGGCAWGFWLDYPMGNHPVVMVTWHGAVAYCNWTSQRDGLTPAYDLSTWELITPVTGGYRLPTEAEWERAAAWDGAKHWIYGYLNDTMDYTADVGRCNFANINPFRFDFFSGCYFTPYTVPSGWYDGVNISPQDNVQTVDSPSPVGCYDMTGNVDEWCQDWYGSDYYTGDPVTNPPGPATGEQRVVRGGSFSTWMDGCRTADRSSATPGWAMGTIGFRVAR